MDISYKKIISTCILAWVLLCLLQVALLSQYIIDIEKSLIDSVVTNTLLAIICFAMSCTLRYYQPGKKRFWNLFFWSIALAAIWIWVAKQILGFIFATDPGYLLFLNQSLPIRFGIGLLIIGWIVLLSWTWNSIQTQIENDNRKAQLEKLAKEAELAGLRQQLQPHFLFNSLNSISALAGSRPEEARLMIQQLSDFLRGTLKKDEQQMRTLEEELRHLQLYLEIEKVRFGHRLNIVINNDPACTLLVLPTLLLQPIVENAIKFGLYDTIGEITISIQSKKEGQNLVITIENPFDQSTAKPQEGNGFGLSSVQRKLYLLFARKDLMQTNSKDNLFTTTVSIPQTK